MGWSREPALPGAPLPYLNPPYIKPCNQPPLLVILPHVFLIKFAASFKHQSMNHPHFLQIPLKMWTQTTKSDDTQRNVSEEALPGAFMATAGAREENRGKTRKTWPTEDFQRAQTAVAAPNLLVRTSGKKVTTILKMALLGYPSQANLPS